MTQNAPEPRNDNSTWEHPSAALEEENVRLRFRCANLLEQLRNFDRCKYELQKAREALLVQEEITALLEAEMAHNRQGILSRLHILMRFCFYRLTWRGLFRPTYAWISASGLFNEKYYLDQHPDIIKAKVNPLLHYMLHGAHEGRDPSPLFDTSWYLSAYPDVAASNINPLLHYYLHGLAEGRKPRRPVIEEVKLRCAEPSWLKP